MSSQRSTKEEYWDWFYANARFEFDDVPSQFAAFVLAEFKGCDYLIDVGCGTGRDAFFFARYLPRVSALDASSSAVQYCQRKKKHQAVENLGIYEADVRDYDQVKELLEADVLAAQMPVLYARFFLHAIDEVGEGTFLRLASLVCQNSGFAAVEFRTHRDEQQEKVTASHYRRYINPLAFMERARGYDLSMRYFTEGFGFAKYKNDDAHVARFILHSI